MQRVILCHAKCLVECRFNMQSSRKHTHSSTQHTSWSSRAARQSWTIWMNIKWIKWKWHLLTSFVLFPHSIAVSAARIKRSTRNWIEIESMLIEDVPYRNQSLSIRLTFRTFENEKRILDEIRKQQTNKRNGRVNGSSGIDCNFSSFARKRPHQTERNYSNFTMWFVTISINI